jgi:uncharacterized protein YndB with AHSA1/START domain
VINNNYTEANYATAIEIAKSPKEVFSHLVDLSKWWPEEFIGESIKHDSEFVFKTGEGHYSKNRVIEFVPNKKLAWLTTGSRRESDMFDWTGTKFIFELIPQGNTTVLKFTYDGVVLKNESERFVQICDMTLKEFFYNFIMNGRVK